MLIFLYFLDCAVVARQSQWGDYGHSAWRWEPPLCHLVWKALSKVSRNAGRRKIQVGNDSGESKTKILGVQQLYRPWNRNLK